MRESIKKQIHRDYHFLFLETLLYLGWQGATHFSSHSAPVVTLSNLWQSARGFPEQTSPRLLPWISFLPVLRILNTIYMLVSPKFIPMALTSISEFQNSTHCPINIPLKYIISTSLLRCYRNNWTLDLLNFSNWPRLLSGDQVTLEMWNFFFSHIWSISKISSKVTPNPATPHLFYLQPLPGQHPPSSGSRQCLPSWSLCLLSWAHSLYSSFFSTQ